MIPHNFENMTIDNFKTCREEVVKLSSSSGAIKDILWIGANTENNKIRGLSEIYFEEAAQFLKSQGYQLHDEFKLFV